MSAKPVLTVADFIAALPKTVEMGGGWNFVSENNELVARHFAPGGDIDAVAKVTVKITALTK